MTQPLKPPLAAVDISPEWIALVRAVIVRDRHVLRGSEHHPTIEVKSTPRNLWMPLMLPNSGTDFVSVADRDAVLKQLKES